MEAKEKTIYKYIDVKSYKTGKVVKRIDVSGKSDNQMDKIENGMNRNLNHEEFYTLGYDSETKKGII